MGSPSSTLSSKPSTSGFGSETMMVPPPPQNMFSSRKSSSCNVKIVQTTTKRLPSGKIEFSGRNQLYIDVTEATANLTYVTLAVQRKWGPEFVIVTADGLKLEDSSGMQGNLALYELFFIFLCFCKQWYEVPCFNYVYSTHLHMVIIINTWFKNLIQVVQCPLCPFFTGLKFWKFGSRKLFAVRETELKDNLKKSSSTGSHTIINL